MLTKVHLRSYYHYLRYLVTKQGVRDNIKFKNKYAGQRCFLICTGKSVLQFDFSLLQNEWSLGCNLLFRHPDAKKLKFAGYFDLDPPSSHYPHPDPYWREGGYHRDLAEFTNSVGSHLFQRLGLKPFCDRYGAFFKSISYIQTSGLLDVSKSVHNDMAGRMNVLDGVAYTMLGAAQYMGFSEIYLIGCDYTVSPRQVGHFYDDTLLKDFVPVDERHIRMRDFLKSKGVKVTNLIMPGFESPVYDSMLIQDFMEQQKKKSP